MEKKRRRALLLLIPAMAGLLGILAYGSWLVQRSTDNFLTMASYKAGIVEEYAVPPHVDPGQTVDKRVQVKNEGTVDILVRVFIKKAFGTRDRYGMFQEDPSLDPEVIEIACNNTDWAAHPDGWFYYRRILKAGQSTEPLMESYTLFSGTGNAYKGKEARIIVTMESVQAEGDALSAWNVTWKDLGIRRPSGYQTKETKVTYAGRTRGFEIDASGTDLFVSFKNLVPGCARSQNITVKNTSGEEAEIFLRAEETGQGSMSEKQRRLVRQLLEKYAQIEVREGERLLYQGAVCGEDGQASMRRDISLGSFTAGASRRLTVRLSLSPEMDNEYQELTGKVTWVFSARGEDGEMVQASVPKTGDDTDVVLWSALLAACSVILTLAAKGKRRRLPALPCPKEREERDETSEKGA